MAGEKIFIVEDEVIVAEDLKRMLERLGYIVVGTAATGDVAIKKIGSTKPDLVLMDIRIKGPLDGIDVAEHVSAQHEIPVIYLTAYADDITVDRAKGTLASGYILKPFEERGLKIKLELALYRHKMDRLLKTADDWHGAILGNLSVAVAAVDLHGSITYMNKMAETLTGHAFQDSVGKKIKEIYPAHLNGRESSIIDSEGNVVGNAIVLESQSS